MDLTSIMIDCFKIASNEFNKVFNIISMNTLGLINSWLNSNLLKYCLLTFIVLSSILMIYMKFYKGEKVVIKSMFSMLTICSLITVLKFSFDKFNLFILNSDILNKSDNIVFSSNFVIYECLLKIGYALLLVAISVYCMMQLISLWMLILCLPFSIISIKNELIVSIYVDDIFCFIVRNILMPICLLMALPVLNLHPMLLIIGGFCLFYILQNINKTSVNIALKKLSIIK